MTPCDASIRRSIQDLALSMDPNIKIERELLLDVADEFIHLVTKFGCRLARHRGGDTLEVRDLQLHVERNHNIGIPGFASDMTPIALSQAGPAPTTRSAQSTKKGAQGTQNLLRAHRLAHRWHRLSGRLS
ncbi:Transcription initiation factor TFIID subunit A domain containing protein [Russula decolorans]